MGLRLGKKVLLTRQFLSRPEYTSQFYYFRKLAAPWILRSKPIRTPIKGDWAVRYLTCRDQVLETLWSAKSLYQYVDVPIYFHEDGSFDPQCFRFVQEHFPDARIITRKESDAKTIPLLGGKSLEMRRRHAPLLRLFDFQVWANEPYLQVDSDVLFFARPDELLERGSDARFNCGGLNDHSNLTWERSHIKEKTGLDLKGGFNSGLLYFPHRVDFKRIENWFKVLGESPRLWGMEQTMLNLEAAIMGMKSLGPQYDIYEVHWPDVISEHYLQKTRLNMYRRGYPILKSFLC